MPSDRIAYTTAIAAARGAGQDCVCVFETGKGVIIVVADGAGGTGNGAIAAQAIIDAVGAIDAAGHNACAMLRDLDRDAQLRGRGLSTAVIVAICGGMLGGTSVGDSGAWLVRDTDVVDLTEGQHRKPLVGASCVLRRLPATPFAGTLLIASDGLFHYARQTEIARIVRGPDLSAAAHALIELVRLPSGALQDDVAVVLCREACVAPSARPHANARAGEGGLDER